MDKNIPIIKPEEVITTYRHKQTGEVFKERKDWEAKGFKNRRDGTGRKSHYANT